MVVDPLVKLDGVYLANKAYVPLLIGTHSGPRCPRWTPLINQLDRSASTALSAAWRDSIVAR
jgi:hypothetical protein